MTPDDVPFVHTLAAVADLASAAGVEVLVVGATARDIALSADGVDTAHRATNDVDLGVAVESAEAFARLTTNMTPAQPGHAHKYIVEGVEVDVVPFGGLEREDRTIVWPDGTVMNTLGFSEALSSALKVDIGGGQIISVATLVAQTALKLFAWVDRGGWTDRDAVDLRILILAYSEGKHLDEVYAPAQLDVLARYEYEPRRAGAFLLGRDLRAQLGDSVAEQAAATIDSELVGEGRIVSAMGRLNADENAQLLVALRQGLG
jgi:predicted nucleotidyltransferase